MHLWCGYSSRLGVAGSKNKIWSGTNSAGPDQ